MLETEDPVDDLVHTDLDDGECLAIRLQVVAKVIAAPGDEDVVAQNGEIVHQVHEIHHVAATATTNAAVSTLDDVNHLSAAVRVLWLPQRRRTPP